LGLQLESASKNIIDYPAISAAKELTNDHHQKPFKDIQEVKLKK
jgi:hypothetical protein